MEVPFLLLVLYASAVLSQDIDYYILCSYKGTRTLAPYDQCHQFWKCEDRNTILYTCPEKSHFNIESQKCEYAGTVDCGERSSPYYPTRSPESICSESNADGKRFVSKMCNEYAVCVGGHLLHYDCPEYQFFDSDKKTCELSQYVDCGNRINPTDGNLRRDRTFQLLTCANLESDGKRFPNKRCNEYIACEHGALLEYVCPLNYLYDVINESCEPSQDVNCGDRINPSDRQILHENLSGAKEIYYSLSSDITYIPSNYCNEYIACSQSMQVMNYKCPHNYYYNVEINSCTSALYVDCGSRIISDERQSASDLDNLRYMCALKNSKLGQGSLVENTTNNFFTKNKTIETSFNFNFDFEIINSEYSVHSTKSYAKISDIDFDIVSENKTKNNTTKNITTRSEVKESTQKPVDENSLLRSSNDNTTIIYNNATCEITMDAYFTNENVSTPTIYSSSISFSHHLNQIYKDQTTSTVGEMSSERPLIISRTLVSETNPSIPDLNSDINNLTTPTYPSNTQTKFQTNATNISKSFYVESAKSIIYSAFSHIVASDQRESTVSDVNETVLSINSHSIDTSNNDSAHVTNIVNATSTKVFTDSNSRNETFTNERNCTSATASTYLGNTTFTKEIMISEGIPSSYAKFSDKDSLISDRTISIINGRRSFMKSNLNFKSLFKDTSSDADSSSTHVTNIVNASSTINSTSTNSKTEMLTKERNESEEIPTVIANTISIINSTKTNSKTEIHTKESNDSHEITTLYSTSSNKEPSYPDTHSTISILNGSKRFTTSTLSSDSSTDIAIFSDQVTDIVNATTTTLTTSTNYIEDKIITDKNYSEGIPESYFKSSGKNSSISNKYQKISIHNSSTSFKNSTQIYINISKDTSSDTATFSDKITDIVNTTLANVSADYREVTFASDGNTSEKISPSYATQSDKNPSISDTDTISNLNVKKSFMTSNLASSKISTDTSTDIATSSEQVTIANMKSTIIASKSSNPIVENINKEINATEVILSLYTTSSDKDSSFPALYETTSIVNESRRFMTTNLTSSSISTHNTTEPAIFSDQQTTVNATTIIAPTSNYNDEKFKKERNNHVTKIVIAQSNIYDSISSNAIDEINMKEKNYSEEIPSSYTTSSVKNLFISDTHETTSILNKRRRLLRSNLTSTSISSDTNTVAANSNDHLTNKNMTTIITSTSTNYKSKRFLNEGNVSEDISATYTTSSDNFITILANDSIDSRETNFTKERNISEGIPATNNPDKYQTISIFNVIRGLKASNLTSSSIYADTSTDPSISSDQLTIVNATPTIIPSRNSHNIDERFIKDINDSIGIPERLTKSSEKDSSISYTHQAISILNGTRRFGTSNTTSGSIFANTSTDAAISSDQVTNIIKATSSIILKDEYFTNKTYTKERNASEGISNTTSSSVQMTTIVNTTSAVVARSTNSIHERFIKTVNHSEGIPAWSPTSSDKDSSMSDVHKTLSILTGRRGLMTSNLTSASTSIEDFTDLNALNATSTTVTCTSSNYIHERFTKERNDLEEKPSSNTTLSDKKLSILNESRRSMISNLNSSGIKTETSTYAAIASTIYNSIEEKITKKRNDFEGISASYATSSDTDLFYPDTHQTMSILNGSRHFMISNLTTSNISTDAETSCEQVTTVNATATIIASTNTNYIPENITKERSDSNAISPSFATLFDKDRTVSMKGGRRSFINSVTIYELETNTGTVTSQVNSTSTKSKTEIISKERKNIEEVPTLHTTSTDTDNSYPDTNSTISILNGSRDFLTSTQISSNIFIDTSTVTAIFCDQIINIVNATLVNDSAEEATFTNEKTTPEGILSSYVPSADTDLSYPDTHSIITILNGSRRFMTFNLTASSISTDTSTDPAISSDHVTNIVNKTSKIIASASSNSKEETTMKERNHFEGIPASSSDQVTNIVNSTATIVAARTNFMDERFPKEINHSRGIPEYYATSSGKDPFISNTQQIIYILSGRRRFMTSNLTSNSISGDTSTDAVISSYQVAKIENATSIIDATCINSYKDEKLANKRNNSQVTPASCNTSSGKDSSISDIHNTNQTSGSISADTNTDAAISSDQVTKIENKTSSIISINGHSKDETYTKERNTSEKKQVSYATSSNDQMTYNVNPTSTIVASSINYKDDRFPKEINHSEGIPASNGTTSDKDSFISDTHQTMLIGSRRFLSSNLNSSNINTESSTDSNQLITVNATTITFASTSNDNIDEIFTEKNNYSEKLSESYATSSLKDTSTSYMLQKILILKGSRRSTTSNRTTTDISTDAVISNDKVKIIANATFATDSTDSREVPFTKESASEGILTSYVTLSNKDSTFSDTHQTTYILNERRRFMTSNLSTSRISTDTSTNAVTTSDHVSVVSVIPTNIASTNTTNTDIKFTKERNDSEGIPASNATSFEKDSSYPDSNQTILNFDESRHLIISNLTSNRISTDTSSNAAFSNEQEENIVNGTASTYSISRATTFTKERNASKELSASSSNKYPSISNQIISTLNENRLFMISSLNTSYKNTGFSTDAVISSDQPTIVNATSTIIASWSTNDIDERFPKEINHSREIPASYATLSDKDPFISNKPQTITVLNGSRCFMSSNLPTSSIATDTSTDAATSSEQVINATLTTDSADSIKAPSTRERNGSKGMLASYATSSDKESSISDTHLTISILNGSLMRSNLTSNSISIDNSTNFATSSDQLTIVNTTSTYIACTSNNNINEKYTKESNNSERITASYETLSSDQVTNIVNIIATNTNNKDERLNKSTNDLQETSTSYATSSDNYSSYPDSSQLFVLQESRRFMILNLSTSSNFTDYSTYTAVSNDQETNIVNVTSTIINSTSTNNISDKLRNDNKLKRYYPSLDTDYTQETISILNGNNRFMTSNIPFSRISMENSTNADISSDQVTNIANATLITDLAESKEATYTTISASYATLLDKDPSYPDPYQTISIFNENRFFMKSNLTSSSTSTDTSTDSYISSDQVRNNVNASSVNDYAYSKEEKDRNAFKEISAIYAKPSGNDLLSNDIRQTISIMNESRRFRTSNQNSSNVNTGTSTDPASSSEQLTIVNATPTSIASISSNSIEETINKERNYSERIPESSISTDIPTDVVISNNQLTNISNITKLNFTKERNYSKGNNLFPFNKFPTITLTSTNFTNTNVSKDISTHILYSNNNTSVGKSNNIQSDIIDNSIKGNLESKMTSNKTNSSPNPKISCSCSSVPNEIVTNNY